MLTWCWLNLLASVIIFIIDHFDICLITSTFRNHQCRRRWRMAIKHLRWWLWMSSSLNLVIWHCLAWSDLMEISTGNGSPWVNWSQNATTLPDLQWRVVTRSSSTGNWEESLKTFTSESLPSFSSFWTFPLSSLKFTSTAPGTLSLSSSVILIWFFLSTL